jgi:PAS domain S-box-containing protein
MIQSGAVVRRLGKQPAQAIGSGVGLCPEDGKAAKSAVPSSPGLDFAALIGGLDVIIWEADAKTWQFTYVSTGAKHILGYPARQWFTEPNFWTNHIHPADREQAADFCAQATARGEDHQFEYRAIASDGRIVWLHDIVRVIKNDVGAPILLRGVMVDISDRKRAEEDRNFAEQALLASEEKFRTLVESAHDAILTIGVSGHIVGLNPGAEQMFGYSKAELLGQSITKLLPERLRAPYSQAFEHYVQTGAQVLGKSLELPCLRRDGTEFPVQLSLASWTAKQERFFTGVMRDVTERKRAEQALRRSADELRLVVEAAQVGISYSTTDGRILLVNPYLLNLFGMTEKDMVGKHVSELNLRRFAEDGHMLEIEEVPSIQAGRTKQDVREKLVRIEGQNPRGPIWVMVTSRPCLSKEGTVERVITTLTDVSERMRAQAALRQTNEALRRSEAELQIIFEKAPFGIALVGPTGTLVRTNPTFQKMLGLSAAELNQKTLPEITHPDDVELVSVPFQELVAGKRNGFRIKNRYLRKAGNICWAWLATSALRDDEGRFRYCVLMVEDITQQELAENSLRELSVRMLHAQQEEQRRIAREIHDSTCQELAALALNLGAIAKSERELSAKTRKRLSESLDLAQRVSREMRTFSYLLHPPMLEEFRLWTATRLFVAEFSNRSGLIAKLRIAPRLEHYRLSPSYEVALFRFSSGSLGQRAPSFRQQDCFHSHRRERATNYGLGWR